MTRDDVVMILATCSSYDRRTVGESDVTAWHDALGDLDGTDARQAVKDWYREHREWIMPTDVRAGVKRIRAERLGNRADECPDVDPDDVPAYLAAIRARRREIASGRAVPRPELETNTSGAARVRAALAGTFRSPGPVQ